MKKVDLNIQNKAKKHKRVFEKYWVDPHHVNLEGNNYYMAFYQRFNATKMAVISSQPNANNDQYKEAFKWLVILINRMGAIHEVGMERKNISMMSFQKTRDFLENALSQADLSESEREVISKCLRFLNEAISLQSQMVELMDKYEQYKKAKNNQFTTQDVEYIHDIHAEMDYIQFTQGNASYKTMDHFRTLSDVIAQNDTVGSLANSEIKQYVQEFSQGKEKLKSGLDEATYVDNLEDLSKEQFMKTVQEDYIKRQRESNKSLIKDLRYPSLT
ncbi:hypothetical protein [Lentibacillus sediminis]|uniref:hypothetical protein n=1 Tax=Lentibacillus sediminis TaxID=1940529 RepID=UPI000C1C4359|nr:hypothetical protein [Lentibacillus sediminis]